MTRLVVFTMGGTIASVPDGTGTGVVPELTGDQLVRSVPQLSGLATVDVRSFRQSASCELTLTDIAELAQVIEAAGDEYDGVVVTQGTDTLEETSFAMSLLAGVEPPIVMTGAMRSADTPGSDGPANLLAAARVAASAEAKGLGPLLVFADEIHLPRFVSKTHSAKVAGFSSPGAGPVGWVVEDRVRLPLVPRRPGRVVEPAKLGRIPDVAMFRIGIGAGPLPVQALTSFDAVVLETMGGGHVPAAVVASVQEVAARVPVVITTRAGAGELYRSTYGYPGSEQDLNRAGVISAGALPGLKARVLLSLLLASGVDRAADIQREFNAIW